MNCFAGVGCLAFGFSYPLRNVRKITLLKGGDNLAIQVYRGFNRFKTFIIPLEHLSAISHRTEHKSSCLIRIKDRKFNYICDSRDGIFHEEYLWDHHVGLYRFKH